MKTVSSNLVKGKKVLLRYDMDVGLSKNEDVGWKVEEDFRLKAGLFTLRLCLDYAQEVILMGHIGRPNGEDPNFSVEPIYDWLYDNGFKSQLESGKLKLLENLRFEDGEESGDLDYAKELASLGNFFVNEAFASHHMAASTTVLPTLLPHAAGLNFTKEVEVLTKVREDPKRPLVAIIGGVKIEDKLSAIKALVNIADKVLVGGKLTEAILAENVDNNGKLLVAKLNEMGTDITRENIEQWEKIILEAKMILWNGPLGKVEDQQNDSTKKVAYIVLESGAETILGGGDTIKVIDSLGLLPKVSFVSTGGGAMLEFLTTGTLPTIEVLQ